MIANKVDREYWEAELGIYYICAQAYDALSSSISVLEDTFNYKLVADFDTLYNFFVERRSF